MTTITEAMNQYLAMVQQRTRRHPNADLNPARRNRKTRQRQTPDGAPEPFVLNKPQDVETATTRSYRNSLQAFGHALLAAGIDPSTTDIRTIQEDWVKHVIAAHLNAQPATLRLYLSAVSKFYHHLVAERLAEVNLPRVREIIGGRTRKLKRRIPAFPREEIERLIAYAETLADKDVEPVTLELKTEAGKEAARRREQLRNLRDRAFILVLSDTGLRCSEACALTRGDINRHDGVLTVTGKGGDEARVRVSERALRAIRTYLDVRDQYQPPDARLIKAQPLFMRHDRGARHDRGGRDVRAGKTQRGIAAGTGWEIVKERAREALGADAAELIHPHSFRHYFVTIVLLATNNMEKARKLARHKSITTTQLYAEVDPELDQDYHDIFNGK